MSLPRIIHHLEGLLVGGASVWLYFAMGESGALFALIILAPDLGMLG